MIQTKKLKQSSQCTRKAEEQEGDALFRREMTLAKRAADADESSSFESASDSLEEDILVKVVEKTCSENTKKADAIISRFNQPAPLFDHLYIGDAQMARDALLLKQFGITHVINLSCLDIEHKGQFEYLKIDVSDTPRENIRAHFDATGATLLQF